MKENIHELKETGKTLHPCKCRVCTEEFQTWEARRAHSKEVHGITTRTGCQCPECGMTFMSRKARHGHVMMAHRAIRAVVTPYSSRRAKRQRRGGANLALLAHLEKANGQPHAAS